MVRMIMIVNRAILCKIPGLERFLRLSLGRDGLFLANSLRMKIISGSLRRRYPVDAQKGDNPMKTIQTVALAATVAMAPLTAASTASAVDKSAVLETYADIAHAAYEDSLTTAQSLQRAVDILVKNPTEATLAVARNAWLKARAPYQQTEAYRFGNAAVDDWEGKVNA